MPHTGYGPDGETPKAPKSSGQNYNPKGLRCKELRWDDLETIRKKHLAIVMYELINNKAPGYLINLFDKSNSGVYALRDSESRLLLPKYNTEFAKSSSFFFIGAKIWNTIPYHIITAPTLSALKKKQINSLAVIYVLYIYSLSVYSVF